MERVIWEGDFPTLDKSPTDTYRVVLIEPVADEERTERISETLGIHMRPIVRVEKQCRDVTTSRVVVLGAVYWELSKSALPIEAALLTLLAQAPVSVLTGAGVYDGHDGKKAQT